MESKCHRHQCSHAGEFLFCVAQADGPLALKLVEGTLLKEEVDFNFVTHQILSKSRSYSGQVRNGGPWKLWLWQWVVSCYKVSYSVSMCKSNVICWRTWSHKHCCHDTDADGQITSRFQDVERFLESNTWDSHGSRNTMEHDKAWALLHPNDAEVLNKLK